MVATINEGGKNFPPLPPFPEPHLNLLPEGLRPSTVEAGDGRCSEKRDRKDAPAGRKLRIVVSPRQTQEREVLRSQARLVQTGLGVLSRPTSGHASPLRS